MSERATPPKFSTKQSKESLQEKHYLYLNKLQTMARELPGKFQQRLPYDLLSSLASVLLDSTLFDIVASLHEVQQLEEKNLSNERMRLVNEQKAQRLELIRKHKDKIQAVSHLPHKLPYEQTECQNELQALDKRFEDELKKRDIKIIQDLDQKVMDQQSTLQQAGIPGFIITNNQQEIRLQMYLLEFIIRLSELNV